MSNVDTHPPDSRLIVNQIGQSALRLQLGDHDQALAELAELLPLLAHQQLPNIDQLSWAAHNLVCAVQEETTPLNDAVSESLQLASSCISYVFNGIDSGVRLESDVLDELLERMDLLASGTSLNDANLSVTEDQMLPPKRFTDIDFPVAQPADHDANEAIRLEERLLCDLELVKQTARRGVELDGVTSTHFNETYRSTEQIAQLVQSQLDRQKVDLKALFKADDVLGGFVADDIEATHDSTELGDLEKPMPGARIFKSTANRLVSATRELILDLKSQNPSDEWSITLYNNADVRELTVQIAFQNLDLNLDELSSNLLEADEIYEDSTTLDPGRVVEFLLNPDFSASSSTGEALASFDKEIQALGGFVSMKVTEESDLVVRASLNRNVRPESLLQFSSDGDSFAINATTVEVVVPACSADYDRVSNSIVHNNEHFEYLQYGHRIRPLAPHAKDWGLIVLIRASQRIALRVDSVESVSEHAVRSAQDNSWRGHAHVTSEKFPLLLDPDALTSDTQTGSSGRREINATRFLIANVSADDRKRLRDTISSLGCAVLESHGTRETIQQMQEWRPDFLVVAKDTIGESEELIRRVLEATSFDTAKALMLEPDSKPERETPIVGARDNKSTLTVSSMLQRTDLRNQLLELIRTGNES